MRRIDGSLVKTLPLDFGELTTIRGERSGRLGLPRRSQKAKAGLRMGLSSCLLRGPDKYRVLEHRRRQAQINARRLLGSMK